MLTKSLIILLDVILHLSITSWVAFFFKYKVLEERTVNVAFFVVGVAYIFSICEIWMFFSSVKDEMMCAKKSKYFSIYFSS